MEGKKQRQMTKQERIIELLKRYNYWQGKIKERKFKFSLLNQFLNKLYGKNITLIFDIPKRFSKWSFSGRSRTDGKLFIILEGRLSLITFLHEWGHILKGHSQTETQNFAVNLFKEAYPKRYKKLKLKGAYCLIKKKNGKRKNNNRFKNR